MTGWRQTALDAARSLWRNALAGASIVVVVLLAAAGTGCIAPLPSLLIMASGLAALASAAYLIFDALLFRLASSHGEETGGLSAIDDTLDRMALRKRPDTIRPLGDRIAGSRRILHIHRITLAAFMMLYALSFIDGAARC